MKKITWSLLLFSILVLSFSSCNRQCKGGGWYGNRNLSAAPTKEKLDLKEAKKEETAELVCP